MSDDYPEYEKLPRDNKICGNFLNVIHQNQTDGGQKLTISVDVEHMSTPSIRLWCDEQTPNPRPKGTDPIHTFEFKKAGSRSKDVTVAAGECLWAAASSDVNRVHLLRIVRGSGK